MLGGVGACETYLLKQAFTDGGGFGQYLNITKGVWLQGSEEFGLCMCICSFNNEMNSAQNEL